jgi:hypothetical protein
MSELPPSVGLLPKMTALGEAWQASERAAA